MKHTKFHKKSTNHSMFPGNLLSIRYVPTIHTMFHKPYYFFPKPDYFS